MLKMKNLNGTSRDGGDVNYKEGMKLLDIGSSDSDVQEHFALPPLELKGARKKKGRTSKPAGGGGGCNCWKGVAACLLLVAIVGIGGVGFFTYSIHKELQELRKKFDSVETGSQGNPEEFQNLHHQVQELQADIQKIRSGETNSLGSHQANISAIVKQISSLNMKTDSLGKSLAAAPALADLPEQVSSVSVNVAKIGSEVTSLKAGKADVSLIKPLEDKINNISGRLLVLEGNPSLEKQAPSRPDLLPLQQALRNISHNLDAVNTTVWMKIADLRIHSNRHMAELEEVHNITLALLHRVEFLEMTPLTPIPSQAGHLQTLVQEAVSHAMWNVSHQKGDSVDSVEMQELQRVWLNTTSAIAILRRQLQQLNVTEAVMKLTARVDNLTTTTNQQIQDLGRSLAETKIQVSDMASNARSHESQPMPSSEQTSTMTEPPMRPSENVKDISRNEDSKNPTYQRQVGLQQRSKGQMDQYPSNISQMASRPQDHYSGSGQMASRQQDHYSGSGQMASRSQDHYSGSGQMASRQQDRMYNTAVQNKTKQQTLGDKVKLGSGRVAEQAVTSLISGPNKSPPADRTYSQEEKVDQWSNTGDRAKTWQTEQEEQSRDIPAPSPSTGRILQSPAPPSSTPSPFDGSPTAPARNDGSEGRNEQIPARGRRVRGSPRQVDNHDLDSLVNAIQNEDQ